MAKQPTIKTITSGYASKQTLNNNFEALRDGFDNTLSRDGSTPNAMLADIDMNGNDILNVDFIGTNTVRIGNEILTEADLAGGARGIKLYRENLSGDGVNIEFGVALVPNDANQVDVYIDGVYQNKDSYFLNPNGRKIVFSEAPPVGTNNIEIITYLAIEINEETSSISDEFVNVRDFGAVGNVPNKKIRYITGEEISGANDDTAAIQAALDTGRHVYIPNGIYKLSGELEIKTHGQMIVGAGKGSGYGIGSETYADHIGGATLLWTGGSQSDRRRLTRRLSPEAFGDQDDPNISAQLNIQAESVTLKDFCVATYTDFTAYNANPDNSNDPTNLGADWDVGVFIGCRVFAQLNNIKVVGYNRIANIYLDQTRGAATAEHLAKDFTPYDEGNVQNGADGLYMYDCITKGGLKGFVLAGPVFDNASGDYYDYRTGQVIPNNNGADATGRGGFGASDLHAINCTFYSRDHHSNWRAYDPVISTNTPTTPEEELLTSEDEIFEPLAACFAIDGVRGSETQGRVRRIRATNCRFPTIEAARIVLSRAWEVVLDNVHTEPRSPSLDNKVKDTAGNVIAWSSQSLHNYGPILAKKPYTDDVAFEAATTLDERMALCLGGIGAGAVEIININASPSPNWFNAYPVQSSAAPILTGTFQTRAATKMQKLELEEPLNLGGMPYRFTFSIPDDTVAVLNLEGQTFFGNGLVSTNSDPLIGNGAVASFGFRSVDELNNEDPPQPILPESWVAGQALAGNVSFISNTVLTGTTGPDNNLNIGADNTNLYIENRTGGLQSILLTMFI